MICPVCRGRGEVRTRFLWFFGWRRSCWSCGGTGLEPGPPRSTATTSALRDERDRDWPRDRTDDSFTSASRGSAAERVDPFVVGGGGESGGGGGGASWSDDSGSRDAGSRAPGEPPLIVDPFVADAQSDVTLDSAPAVSDARSADAGSSSESESSDGGTTY